MQFLVKSKFPGFLGNFGEFPEKSGNSAILITYEDNAKMRFSTHFQFFSRTTRRGSWWSWRFCSPSSTSCWRTASSRPPLRLCSTFFILAPSFPLPPLDSGVTWMPTFPPRPNWSNFSPGKASISSICPNNDGHVTLGLSHDLGHVT